MVNAGQSPQLSVKRLLTPAETAARLNVHTKTLERWRFEGRGPDFVKLGPRTVRYKRSAVEQLES